MFADESDFSVEKILREAAENGARRAKQVKHDKNILHPGIDNDSKKESVTYSVRMSLRLRNELEKRAKAERRSKNYIAVEAICKGLNLDLDEYL